MLTRCDAEQFIGSLCSLSLKREANQCKFAHHAPCDMAVFTNNL